MLIPKECGQNACNCLGRCESEVHYHRDQNRNGTTPDIAYTYDDLGRLETVTQNAIQTAAYVCKAGLSS